MPVSVSSASLASSAMEFAAGYKWSLFGLAVAVFVYWFFEPPRRRAPSVDVRYPILANLPGFVRNYHRFHDWITDASRRANGKSFVLYMPTDHSPIWHLNSPEGVKHVTKLKFESYIKSGSEFVRELMGTGILAVNGDEWRRHRKIYSLMFSGRLLAEHCENVFATKSAELVSLLRRFAVPLTPGGEKPVLDMSDILARVTMDVISQIGFGRSESTLSMYPKVDTLTECFDAIQDLTAARLRFPTLVWRTMRDWKITANEQRLAAAVRTFDSGLLEIVNTRRRAPKVDRMKYYDIISSFLLAAEERGDPAPSDTFLRDVTAALIVAGRDTTATLLPWVFYRLAMHPEVESKLLDEIDHVCPLDTVLDADTLKRTEYLNSVIWEVLRLHPPVPYEYKICCTDDTLPDGSQVKAGDGMAYPVYSLNRNQTVWGPDADVFRPERFMPFEKEPDQYVMPVFNAGPRICLGKRQALDEARIVIISVLQHFRMRLVNDPKRPIEYHLTLTLKMKYGLPMTVEPRKTRAA